MYNIKKTTEAYRDKPWNIPCDDRILKIKNAKMMGQKTVVYLYQSFDSSTFRYRGYNVTETLDYSFFWCGAYFQFDERSRLIEIFKFIDILVFIRCPWDEQMENFIFEAKNNQIKLCYDIDDLVFSTDYMSYIIESLGLKDDFEINFWYGILHRNYMVAKKCDAFITTNEYLAGFLKTDFEKPCYTLQNYLNRYQEMVSQEYFNTKTLLTSQKPFEIGYFSGSPTHVNDLLLIMPEIENFIKKHEDVTLKIVGYMELPEKYRYLVEKNKISFVPFQSFTGLQYEQAKVDVNVVPLLDNKFSNCKSELKFFENAIVGTVTCASPRYTYKKAINNMKNGYLCEVGKWEEIFEKLYEEGQNIEQQEEIRNYAIDKYSSKNQVDKVEEILNSIDYL